LTKVIDASALLAILFDEPGADIAIAHSRNGFMSAVNLCESIERVIRVGGSAEFVIDAAARFEINILPFGSPEAVIASQMRGRPGYAGISLADRACIATAQVRGLGILTADRAWSTLGLDKEIVQIR
jgi:PIN domain nuclease of toxin-antitoxin system